MWRLIHHEVDLDATPHDSPPPTASTPLPSPPGTPAPSTPALTSFLFEQEDVLGFSDLLDQSLSFELQSSLDISFRVMPDTVPRVASEAGDDTASLSETESELSASPDTSVAVNDAGLNTTICRAASGLPRDLALQALRFDMPLPRFTRLRCTTSALVQSSDWLVRQVYAGTSRHTFLAKSSSVGRRIALSPLHLAHVKSLVNKLEEAGLVVPARRCSFVSFPFLVPKATGEPRLIIDYSHLRGKYFTPPLHLPAFAQVIGRSAGAFSGAWFARIDLASAFYSMPVPDRLQAVTTFRVESKTYQFRVLPMGLFISPALLTRRLVEVLSHVDSTWTHVDDILIFGASWAAVYTAIRKAVVALHEAGFQ